MAYREGKDEKRNTRLMIAVLILIFIGGPIALWNYTTNSNYNNLDTLFQYATDTYAYKTNSAHYIATVEATPTGSSACAWIGTAIDYSNNPVITVTVVNDMSRFEARDNYKAYCSNVYHISKKELEDLIINEEASEIFRKVRADQKCNLEGNLLDSQGASSDIRKGAKMTYASL